jgi:hypothetical protein
MPVISPIVYRFILSPLYDPEAFHRGNYIESPNNVGVSFTNKKAPVRRLFEKPHWAGVQPDLYMISKV